MFGFGGNHPYRLMPQLLIINQQLSLVKREALFSRREALGNGGDSPAIGREALNDEQSYSRKEPGVCCFYP